MAKVKARADTVAANSRNSLTGWLRKMKGCTLLEGHARFEAPDRLRVGADILTAPRIFINVGGRPSVPPLPGINVVPFLTNRTMLEPSEVPGTWWSSAAAPSASSSLEHRHFGAGSRSSSASPPDAGGCRPRKRSGDPDRQGHGPDGAECVRWAVTGGVAVSLDCAEGDPRLPFHVLLAVVAVWTTSGWTRPGGDRCAPSSPWTIPSHQHPRIWALGDCNGRSAFTHTAYNDFEIVAANLLDSGHRHLGPRPRVCPLHRSAPRARGPDRDRSAGDRPPPAHRPASNDPRRPGHREG